MVKLKKLIKLIETEEAMEKFIVDYRIPPSVNLRHRKMGEWYELRGTGDVVIPVLAFVEGGMRIPMGPVVGDYLRHFRLAPTQCAANMFRILGCVDALNEKIELRLTHHNVNWCYNIKKLRGKVYYMKTRDERVRLIQCLPDSNKRLNKDFLIVSGEWHNSVPCPMLEGEPSAI